MFAPGHNMTYAVVLEQVSKYLNSSVETAHFTSEWLLACRQYDKESGEARERHENIEEAYGLSTILLPSVMH